VIVSIGPINQKPDRIYEASIYLAQTCAEQYSMERTLKVQIYHALIVVTHHFPERI
jgi:hypothetical protein